MKNQTNMLQQKLVKLALPFSIILLSTAYFNYAKTKIPTNSNAISHLKKSYLEEQRFAKNPILALNTLEPDGQKLSFKTIIVD